MPVLTRFALAVLVLNPMLVAPALAASVCADASDMAAFRTAAVQQQLMVAALTCRDVEVYNRFVLAYQPELQKSDADLKAYFIKRGSEAAYDTFKTKLANLSSLSDLANGAAYCDNAAAAFDMALKIHPALSSFVADQRLMIAMPQQAACSETKAIEAKATEAPVAEVRVQTAAIKAPPVKMAEAKIVEAKIPVAKAPDAKPQLAKLSEGKLTEMAPAKLSEAKLTEIKPDAPVQKVKLASTAPLRSAQSESVMGVPTHALPASPFGGPDAAQAYNRNDDDNRYDEAPPPPRYYDRDDEDALPPPPPRPQMQQAARDQDYYPAQYAYPARYPYRYRWAPPPPPPDDGYYSAR